jgi:hypothetical protein
MPKMPTREPIERHRLLRHLKAKVQTSFWRTLANYGIGDPLNALVVEKPYSAYKTTEAKATTTHASEYKRGYSDGYDAAKAEQHKINQENGR